MPASSATASDANSWNGSWPPAQVHLQSSNLSDSPHDTVLPPTTSVSPHGFVKSDGSPMAYFLAPPRPLLAYDEDSTDYQSSSAASDLYDENEDDDSDSYYAFGFDAGIEDAAHPRPMARSVSPSSLAEDNATRAVAAAAVSLGSRQRGMHTTLFRPPTPPRVSTRYSDDDEDAEDYVRLGSSPNGAERRRDDNCVASRTTPLLQVDSHNYLNFHQRLQLQQLQQQHRQHIQHPTHPYGLDADDAVARGHSRTGARLVRRRSPRSWRVPSPEVFSIEEEREPEEMQGVSYGSGMPPTGSPVSLTGATAMAVLETLAAKPQKKKVRFVLPHESG